MEFVEGSLRIDFPDWVSVRRFDGPDHGLSNCMKAVDLMIDTPKRIYYVEIKDPEHPGAREQDRQKFARRFERGELDSTLTYKFRDSFLYEWARGAARKPIHYLIIVAIAALDEAFLQSRSEELKRQIPLMGPSGASWRRPIAEYCAVFNIQTWNEYFGDWPLSRVSADHGGR